MHRKIKYQKPDPTARGRVQISVRVPYRIKTYLDAVSYEKGISRSALTSMILTESIAKLIKMRKITIPDSYPIEIVKEDVILTVDGKSWILDPLSASRSQLLMREGSGTMVGPVYNIMPGWGTHPMYDMWVVDFENERCRTAIPAKNMWPDPCFECEKACLVGDEATEEPRPANCPMPESIA